MKEEDLYERQEPKTLREGLKEDEKTAEEAKEPFRRGRPVRTLPGSKKDQKDQNRRGKSEM